MLTPEILNLDMGRNPVDTLGKYFGLLVTRNQEKYGSYVFAIKWFSRILIFFHGGVSKAMNYQYGGLRIIDDRIDGDLKNLDIDIIDYTHKRFRILTALTDPLFSPETPEDLLLQEAISIARKYGKEEEIVKSIRLIIASMFFDAKRIQKFREAKELEFLKKSDLDEHFFNLDIMGTGMGMLVYLGSKDIGGDLEKLKNIGRACRIEYNLHDFIEDLKQGIVNISKEEADRFQISKTDLSFVVNLPTILDIDKKDPAFIWYQDIGEYPEGIRKWLQAQIAEYDELIKVFMEKEFPKFPKITRIVFQKFYVEPTQNNILRLKNHFS